MKTKSMRTKTTALTLAAVLLFGATASGFGNTAKAAEVKDLPTGVETETVNNDDPVLMATPSKDRRSLENYLKSIAPADKDSLLVEKGTGTSIDPSSLKPELQSNGNSLRIIRREKATAESPDLATIDGNMNGIYPGALVHADSRLVDGRPTVINAENLPRKAVTVGVDLNGNTENAETVENPNQHNVAAAINKQVNKWKESGQTAAAKVTFRSAMADDEKQLETQLGLKDAGKKYGIDFNANIKGEKKDMLVCYDQVYYTAKVDPSTASSLFKNGVTPADLKDNGIDENNPGVAEVTSIDYGRRIVVKLSTNKMSKDIEAAWNASIGTNGIENKNKYKSIMDNTTYSVFAYGGKTETAGKLITTTSDIAEVNKIIAEDINFKKDSAVCPLSYSTNFIDDGSNASVSRATEYVKTIVENRGPIRVKTNAANWYVTKHQKLYGRPIIGVNDDGSYQLGAWENLMNEGTGDKSKIFNGKYAEFGFSFDITAGTDWPYSDVFWTSNQGVASDISIEWGGTCRTSWIKIDVDGQEVVHNTNCSSHNEYNFGC